MKTTIKIQDLDSNHLKDLVEDSLLDEIFGGDGSSGDSYGSSTGAPNANTSFAYDAAYYITAATVIYLKLNPATSWLF